MNQSKSVVTSCDLPLVCVFVHIRTHLDKYIIWFIAICGRLEGGVSVCDHVWNAFPLHSF